MYFRLPISGEASGSGSGWRYVGARILIKEEERRAASVRPSTPTAWRVIGWFGLVLAVIGLADALVNWYPLALGSPEWEFGTISTTLGSLPLITMGLAGLLGSMLARGSRAGVMAVGSFVLLVGLVVLGLYVLFLTDVPMALRATAGKLGGLPIRRGIVRTSILGVGFGVGYLAAAIMSLLSLRRRAIA